MIAPEVLHFLTSITFRFSQNMHLTRNRAEAKTGEEEKDKVVNGVENDGNTFEVVVTEVVWNIDIQELCEML